MIEFRNVTKSYQMGDETVMALENATLTIKDGEFVSVIGPSGSGKSTLMNIMGCLDTATSGQYILDGIPIEKYSENDLARIRSKKIGFIFQSFNLINTLTAAENVELPLIYQKVPSKERKERAAEALKRVDLYERRNHKPSQLSGGQQQRAAIARAMASRPSLYLADEPTGNLDQKTGMQIMDIFRELHSAGSTIVFITHDDHLAAMAERRINIVDGHVSEV